MKVSKCMALVAMFLISGLDATEDLRKGDSAVLQLPIFQDSTMVTSFQEAVTVPQGIQADVSCIFAPINHADSDKLSGLTGI